MSTDFKIIIVALALVVWLVSFFVRQQNRSLGVKLSWIAVILAMVSVVMFWLT
ncbi:MAG: hypothetical protein J6T60_07940 [Bacteroidales bacterium]|nr:hypothetical protein [Bacteroidales bacterium]MBO7567011.1 hypothetical protein [Bacteroidales bacterium]